MLDKSKLGNRYSCFACGTKFYDLNKTPATCPECGASQEDAPTRDKMRDALGRGQSSKAVPEADADQEASLEIPDTNLEAEGLEDMDGMHLVDEDDEQEEGLEMEDDEDA